MSFETHALADGEIITEPGVYRMSMERYHGQPCDGPSVSSSGLRTLLLKSPKHFYSSWSGNPNFAPKGATRFMIKGRAAHHLLLGEREFYKEFAVKPTTLGGAPWNANRNECKAWLKEMAEKKLTVIDADWMTDIQAMSRELAQNPLIQHGLLNGLIEHSIMWKDQETGIWLKIRPDAIPSSSGDVADLKTTSSIGDEEIARSIYNYGYNVQGALIGIGLREALKIEMQSFSLVFIESDEPFCARVKTIHDDDIALGARQIRTALRMMKRCLDAGEWPGPGGVQSDAEYIQIPAWGRTKIENDLTIMEQELSR